MVIEMMDESNDPSAIATDLMFLIVEAEAVAEKVIETGEGRFQPVE